MPDHFDPYHVWLGIPPEESAGGRPNHYRLLGLQPFETNPDVISNALDQRRVFLRSVQAGKRGAQSQQLLNEVSAAGVTLLDPEKKLRYDEELRKQLAPPPPAPLLQHVSPGSPHPTAPLAPTGFPLQNQTATSAPLVRTAPQAKKPPASSAVVIAALVVSSAVTLLVIAGAAWWILSHTGSKNVAFAPPPAAKPISTPRPSIAETSSEPPPISRSTGGPEKADRPSPPTPSPAASLPSKALVKSDTASLPESADATIDLLQILKVSTDTIEGESLQTATYLETHVAEGRSRMSMSYRPPAEYDVDLELTRQEGTGGAFVGLEVAGQPVIVAIDCFPELGGRSGLLPPQLANARNHADLRKTAPLLFTGEQKKATIKVRLQGTTYSIALEQPGGPAVSFAGAISSLAVPKEFAIPLSHGMSLGSIDARIRFHRVALRPVTRDFSPQVLAIMRRAATNVPATTAPLQTKSTGRRPVPESAALTRGEEKARKLYSSELKAATKPPQQEALARQILEAGKATQVAHEDRFILIDLARTLFVKAGEVQNALAAARLLEIDYDIPREQLVTATIEALEDAQLTPERRLELTKTVADLADTAADVEEFERADKLSNIAVQSGTKLRDADFRKDLAQRRAHIMHLLKEWNVVKVSLEKLKSDPTDAAANLAAGKFYCFSREDFNQGLKYLAASSDAQLAEAAKRDVEARSGDTNQRLAAAAAWQQAEGKIVDREDKLAAQRRERWLLQQAVTGLSGFELVKAEKRLNELSNAGALTTGRKAKPSEPPAKAKKNKTAAK